MLQGKKSTLRQVLLALLEVFILGVIVIPGGLAINYLFHQLPPAVGILALVVIAVVVFMVLKHQRWVDWVREQNENEPWWD